MEPIFLTEQILRVMAPFRPGTISYEMGEMEARGKFIRIHIGSLPRQIFRINLDPWYSAYPEEINQIVFEQFRYLWNDFYIEPDDHIVLGME